MSYILDALRKVERERRHHQSPAIGLSENRTQHSRSRWGLFIVIILIALNLIWLAWNTYNQNKSDNIKIGESESVQKSNLNPVQSKPIQPKQLNVSDLSAKTHPQKPQNVPTSPESKISWKRNNTHPINRFPTSIHDLKTKSEQQLQQQQNSSQNGNPKSVQSALKPNKSQHAIPPVRPNMDKKPGAALNQAPPPPLKTPPPVKTNISRPTLKAPPPVKPNITRPIAKVKPVAQPPAAKKKPVQKKRIPLLEQMPRDFQNQIPEMNINVYVQEEHAENAFVIINMRKYRIGDSIDSGLVLKEIGVDGMTLSKQGKLFMVPRP